MPGWTVSQLADLVVSTQHDLGELKYTDLSFDLQDYIGWGQIFKKEKVTSEGGTAIDFNITVSNNGSARGVDLYEEDDYNVSDSLGTGTVPWKHMNANYVINRIRMNMNRSKRRLLNEVELERKRAMGSIIEYAEQTIWNAPVYGSKDFYGVQYWVVRWPTGTTTPGWTGTVPNGFTTVGGISSTDMATGSKYDNYRNWAGQYTSVTKADLVDKMKTAAYKTNFKSPLPSPSYDRGAIRFAYYCNWTTKSALEALLEQQNDNLGFDLDPMNGRSRFQGNPVITVPQLDADTGYPVYGIDWSKLSVKFLSGEELVETTRKASKQHTCVTTDIDCTLNTWCPNRRQFFVLSKTSKTGTSS